MVRGPRGYALGPVCQADNAGQRQGQRCASLKGSSLTLPSQRMVSGWACSDQNRRPKLVKRCALNRLTERGAPSRLRLLLDTHALVASGR